MANKKQAKRNADTGGGRSIHIGGSASGSTIVVGDHNFVTNTHSANVFAPVYQAIQQSKLAEQEKQDVQAEVQEIEGELIKSEPVNETFLTRRLRNVGRMAPDILDVLLTTISSPAAGLGMIAKKLADKMKASA